MKPARLLCAVIVFVLSVATPVLAAGDADEVALFVNEEPIYAWELKLLLPQIQTEMASQGQDTRGQEVIERTLDRAIDSRLLAQVARRRGIEPNEGRISDKMKGLEKRAGGRAELEAELIKSRISYDQLRSTVVQADLVQTLVETEILPAAEVSPQDVEAFYTENPELFRGPDKVHSRHILIAVDQDATVAERQAARQRAEEAHARAAAGEDFAKLAAELSDGPNAATGGDLGFTARGQMVEGFDEAVWSLEPGQISDVVESRLGYHVIKVDEIVSGPVVPFDEARPLVTNLLRQRRTGAALASFVAELRATAVIREPQE
jgi:peptidyl-prolyl cis-trans isomerase C